MGRKYDKAVRDWIPAAFVFLVLSGITVGLSACNGDSGGRDSASAPVERTASIRVESGNGRLASGEEFVIAEWRSGSRDGRGAFADFRGQDGGPTLDLALSGLSGLGSYSCDGSGTASLRLSVDVNNEYRPDVGDCRIEVIRVVDGVAEGRYAATLRHAGNSGDAMKVSGTFRATQAPALAAAKAPKMGMR
jgi:hypothetical protein